MTPQDFQTQPWSSIFRKSEAETVALNIITILKRTGNEWRQIQWEEYKTERLKDGKFTEDEKRYFDSVQPYTVSAEQAAGFAPTWRKIYNQSADHVQ